MAHIWITSTSMELYSWLQHFIQLCWARAKMGRHNSHFAGTGKISVPLSLKTKTAHCNLAITALWPTVCCCCVLFYKDDLLLVSDNFSWFITQVQWNNFYQHNLHPLQENRHVKMVWHILSNSFSASVIKRWYMAWLLKKKNTAPCKSVL